MNLLPDPLLSVRVQRCVSPDPQLWPDKFPNLALLYLKVPKPTLPESLVNVGFLLLGAVFHG